ncbi:MAG: class I SAM-dependent methyltransferase [Chloroflexaceae bacterium]|nr:class I SAM-dependent methyltransferase [Chloroflexaceae bacterium]
MGWIESAKRGYPCKVDGLEIPWMNYAAIAFWEETPKKEFILFEFGSGYSTIFFARLVNKVTSVEYDRAWFQTVEAKIPDNATLIFKEKDIDGAYCRSIQETNQQYDIIIVDGRDRVNCVKQSISVLTPNGAIALDDSQREKYQPAIDYAKKKGFKVLHLDGLKPSEFRYSRTTIFYRDNNCLGI